MSIDTSNHPSTEDTSAADDELILMRRRHRKAAPQSGLNLVAMMDMLTILLVYLITQVADMPGASAANIQLATSSMSGKVLPGTTVMVSMPSAESGVPGTNEYRPAMDGGVTIDNTLACTSEDMAKAGLEKTCLRKALSKVYTDKTTLAGLTKQPAMYDLLIIADNTAPYHYVYSVIASANQEAFTSYRLVVKSEQGGS